MSRGHAHGPDGHGHVHGGAAGHHDAGGAVADPDARGAEGHRHGAGRVDERRRLLGALALTLLILVAEVAGGLWSRSLALLSDAGHMLSDVAAQVLSLVALAIAARPADARRTYGYYRIEILAALVNGMTLIGLAVWIFWSGYLRLEHGVPEIRLGVMMGIALVGLVANLGGVWLLHDAQSLNVKGAYLHLLTDTLSSVAVVVGGAVMWLARGAYWLDPVLSMGIGVFLTYSAFRLVREAVDVLLEAVPIGVDVQGVTAALTALPGVRRIHDLHIWTITSGMHALSAHLVVDATDLAATDRLLATARDLLGARFRIQHSTLQLESGAFDDAVPPCVPCEPPPAGAAG